MSRQQDEYNGAVRIFEALSSVDEELLERSRATKKVIPFGRISKVMAACACFVLLGFVVWYGGRIILPKGGYGSGITESQNLTGQDGGYYEEAVAEDAVEADMEPAEYDADMPENAITENSTYSEKDSYMVDSTPTLSVEKELGEAEVKAVDDLGEYIPTWIPEGYVYENGVQSEDGSVYARWSKGMDDIVITVKWYEAEAESENRIADITRPETYDVHLYEIPYAETVPEEYREVFNHPIFLEKDFGEENVYARIKGVTDSGDTDTPRGRFSVLYENGVLVSFNGDCEPEAVWQMFTSIGQ